MTAAIEIRAERLARYRAFLRAKIATSPMLGFEIEDPEIHPSLKPFQRRAVQWAVKGGRRALFEAFGLGKTRQQLEILRLILKRAGGRGLIVAPLGVRQEFENESAALPRSGLRSTSASATNSNAAASSRSRSCSCSPQAGTPTCGPTSRAC